VNRSHRLALALLLGATPFLSAQSAPQPLKPTAEHEKLGYFAGRWSTTGEMKTTPFGPGGPLTATTNCEWWAGQFYLVCRGEQQSPAGEMKSLGIMGYDTERKRYTYYGIDNSGMGGDQAYATVAGDTWTYEGESTVGGKPLKGRYTIKQLSPDRYTWRYEMSMNGQPYMVMGEGTNTRVK
jgi:hypothetical protein